MAERITIDFGILQGVFGDLQRLEGQLAGISGGVAQFDTNATKATEHIRQGFAGVNSAVTGVQGTMDAAMRGMVEDIMAPVAKTRELTERLEQLNQRVRTSKSVGEITKLKTEIRGVQAELDKVNGAGMEQRLAGPASRLRSLFSGIAGPLAGAFAAGGVLSFGQGVVQAAAAQQSYNTALEVMLQSKGRADALSAQVKSFAATTPFELPQVQAASQQLLAFGFDSTSVIPQMKTLGNVAAALNQPIGDIAYLFGTAKVQGRLYTNDLMQFMNRGIPILGALSQVMGVSEAQVKKLTEEGKVGFAELQKAMDTLGGAGGRFDGLMDAQSRTIGGTLSNLSDAWGQFKADLGMSLAPMLMGGIGMLQSAIGGLRTAFSWIQDNGAAIKGVITGIAVATGIYTAALLVNNAAVMYNSVLVAIAGAGAKMMAVWTNLVSAATTVWTGVQWLLNAALTANPIGLVIAAIAALVGAVLYCWNNFEGFRSFLVGMWETVKSIFGSILDIGSRVFRSLGDVVMGWANILMSALTLDWDGVKAGWSQLKTGLASVLPDPMDFAMAGGKAAEAYQAGAAKGAASFQADQAAKKSQEALVSPAVAAAKGLDATMLTGQNVGAGGLVTPKVPGTGNAGAQGGQGVTVGGGQGGDRNIAMNITLNVSNTIGRDAGDPGRVADQVVQLIMTKLNDAQYAIA